MRNWKWQPYYRETNGKNCQNKKTFNSYKEAATFNNAAAAYHLSGNKRRERLHVYRCMNCRQFHLGHTPVRNRKKQYD